jgi:vacuole morphology and inheritance protein 14
VSEPRGQYCANKLLTTVQEEDSLLESLRWIVEFLDICPEEVLPFTPKILAHMLPAMASGVESTRQAAARVNTCLMDYVVSLSDEPELGPSQIMSTSRLPIAGERHDGTASNRASLSSSRDLEVRTPTPAHGRSTSTQSAALPMTVPLKVNPPADLDYAAAVNSLTLLFLNDHEATRVAALTWLIMLHRKAPRKVLAFNDGTFPALLKTLSDPSEAVVTKDLQLLSQISRNSEDDYFSNFMVNLLQLFSTDRKLLETRGNLIIRQLCVTLSAERIYRTLADCIEKEEDVEFASIMVQNLNNNLITAPELSELRKRLRNLESKVRHRCRVCLHQLLTWFNLGGANVFRSLVSVLVLQCCRNVLSLSARSGLRAGLQPALNIVCLPRAG